MDCASPEGAGSRLQLLDFNNGINFAGAEICMNSARSGSGRGLASAPAKIAV